MPKTVTILGSTGSVGETALRVLRFLGDECRVYGLACRANVAALDRQIAEFRPAAVAVESAHALASEEFRLLRKAHPQVEFLEGEDGVAELASRPVDVAVSAIVGAAGLRPTLACIGAARRLALANKETLVMAGEIVMNRIAEAGTELVPVDSEHSAVFSMMGEVGNYVERIILTASGGSLRDVAVEDLPRVTPRRALAHPTWEMGDKITIDSATLMNKGLEVIEAHHLFGVDYDRIDVMIHAESVVHAMIETADGSIFAHMGVADMAFPVLHALTYPRRVANPFGRLDLAALGRLTFARADPERYPALDLCYRAGRRGGTMPAILNAANEVAVRAFLDGIIPFTDIVRLVDETLETVPARDARDLDDILAADREARKTAEAAAAKLAQKT